MVHPDKQIDQCLAGPRARRIRGALRNQDKGAIILGVHDDCRVQWPTRRTHRSRG